MLQRVPAYSEGADQTITIMTSIYHYYYHHYHYHYCREFQRKVEEVARRERARNQKLETEAALAVTYPDPNEP